MEKGLPTFIGVGVSLAVLLCVPGFPGEAAAATKDPPKTPVITTPKEETLSGTTKTSPVAVKEDLPAPIKLPQESAPVSAPATGAQKIPELPKPAPAVPASAAAPSASEGAPGVKQIETISPVTVPATRGDAAPKKGDKATGDGTAGQNTTVPKVIPISDQEKARIKAKFGKPEIESPRPAKTDLSPAATARPTPVKNDLMRIEDRFVSTARERVLSPKELGRIAGKLEDVLAALERIGPKAGLGNMPGSTGNIPGFPAGPGTQGGDVADRFNRTGATLPGPTNVLTNPSGPMPDNNPLGGHTAQEMFEHQSGETSPGKEAGGVIKPPVASVKSGFLQGCWSSLTGGTTTEIFAFTDSDGLQHIAVITDGPSSLHFSEFEYYETTVEVTLQITDKTTHIRQVYQWTEGNPNTEPVPDLEPLTSDSGEVEITERTATIKTSDRENLRPPAEFFPTVRETIAAVRAAAGTSDPNVTTPREDDGTGRSGSVDPGKMDGGWVKKPVPGDTGPPPVVSPGSDVDTESVRPHGVPDPIDPRPLDGLRPSSGTGE